MPERVENPMQTLPRLDGDSRETLTRTWEGAFPLLSLLVLLGGVTLWVASYGDPLLTRIAITGLINLVIVVGLYVFTGISGIMSFGHFGFVAIGAYVGALLTIPERIKTVLMPDLPGFISETTVATPIGIAAGAAAAGLVALIVSLPLMRATGLPASLATLALLQISFVVASNWEAVTLGTGGISGVPIDIGLGTAFLCAVVALIAAFLYQVSASGLRLRASREDEHAALAAGVRVARERRIAFVVSAVLCGAAGSLYAHYIGTIAPGDFYIAATFLIFAMLVLGGTASLAGAVLGTLVLTAVNHGVIQVEQNAELSGLREVVLALVIIGVLIVRPRGLTGGSEIEWRYVRRAIARVRRIAHGSN